MCLACSAPVYIVKSQMCKKCYMANWRSKNYEYKVPLTPHERFLAKVEKTDDCWIWLGTKNPKGYGKFEKTYVHRFSHEHYKGAIPPGWQIDHLCKNTSCVNPDHLEAVTMQENLRRQHQTNGIYCRYGHEKTLVSGRLRCYVCQSIQKQNKRHANIRGCADVSLEPMLASQVLGTHLVV